MVQLAKSKLHVASADDLVELCSHRVDSVCFAGLHEECGRCPGLHVLKFMVYIK